MHARDAGLHTQRPVAGSLPQRECTQPHPCRASRSGRGARAPLSPTTPRHGFLNTQCRFARLVPAAAPEGAAAAAAAAHAAPAPLPAQEQQQPQQQQPQQPQQQQPQPQQLPASYRRLVARSCGGSFREVAEVVTERLTPPGPGEVLVRVLVAGVNGGCETFRARGEFAFAGNRELQGFALGAEGAGRIVALGPGVKGLQVGQLVALNGAAAFAEYATTRSSLVVPVPVPAPGAVPSDVVDVGSAAGSGGGGGIGPAEAAALVLSGVTACAALEATARIRAGEVVVVTAAAGGTGHFAVQLAALAGCVVVAVVGGPAKAAAAAALGARHVIDYSREDVAASLQRLFPGGVDVVYEGVGGAVRQALLGCLAPGGRLLQVGYISEYPHTTSSNGSSSSSSRSSSGSSSSSTDGGGGGCAGTSTPGANSSTPSSAPAAAAGPASAAATAAGAAATAPPAAELFWGGTDVELGEGRRVIGQIWPKDLKSLLRCRKRVFELAAAGRLRVMTDQGHERQGVEGVAEAIEYMLRGQHVGKVVIRIAEEERTVH
ncbi:hypothetical protein CHLRE_04g229650v5 [Chlamydomonas reinhardtii]|uniref:Enoyl reductase (ER) domain-containing protein n=1 Tax=Chlamydomonas reinhardtii TaxID=3055 RepID=A0A2K3DUX3_CHLRE|nr:uncharacterized protein CHLRE_04g229650v5 [Chlamydomonas reinhardtii]XP_042925441.1 uncharacterized protein CHLRE_04g229650v5 [Chlamydomonas reinhardtii]PNW84326.1 hypothetical protein CHLRE_04g229650v5 [Chlamydomonas reinhardtii]PNW84327.1 hypothetical protein CHLRE_04g229650v5 [Chlamydomonas reinhardtii]